MAATSEPTETYTGEGEGFGWLFFAGTILGLMGIMRIVDAIWAFRFDGEVTGGLQDAVFGEDLTTYAWIWLIVGVILLISSFVIFAGSELARWIGIFAAAITAASAIAWMPYYPIWSLMYIAVGVLVIYALATYGGRKA